MKGSGRFESPTWGTWLLAILVVGNLALWVVLHPSDQPWGRYIGEIVGVEAVLLFSCSLVLATLLPVVERAFDVVRQSSHFWPKPAALLGACRDLAQRDALTGGVNVPEYVDHQAGVYFCSVCQDTGFERGLVCDGSGVCHLKGCGALGSAVESHPFTRRCACRASNPVLQRERDASRRPAPGVAA